MMLHYKLYFIFFLFVCLTACEREKEFPAGLPEKKLTGIKLIVGSENIPGQIISSRSDHHSGLSIEYSGDMQVQTRSIADDPDYQLMNIVVLQFDESGDLMASDYIDELLLSEPVVSQTEVIYTPEITLEEATACTVFVIANIDAPDQFNTIQTLQEMEEYVRLLPDESSLLVSGFIPMTGKYMGPVDEETGIRIILERMFAKFEVTVNTGNLSGSRTVSLEKIQLKSVPTLALYAHTYKDYNFNADYTIQGYPQVPNDRSVSIDPDLFTDYPARELTEGDRMTFYMPENIRGRGYNSNSEGNPVLQQNKYADYDATTIYDATWQELDLNDYELGVCTRFWLTGKYTTPDDGEMNILITLYPGDDIYNDFNVRRNTLYAMTVNINDIDPLHVPAGQIPGADGRIYVWNDNGHTESRTYANPPEFLSPIYEGGIILIMATSYYLDPVDRYQDQLEKVEIVVGLPSGASLDILCDEGTSEDQENFIVSDAAGLIMEYLRGREVITAYTKLTMKDGRIIISETSETIVRPLAF